MCKIELALQFNECPVYWQNMITYIREHGTGFLHESISEYMKTFNAVVDFPNRTITFETEEDKLAYILRWS